jgi:hypothetical protein
MNRLTKFDVLKLEMDIAIIGIEAVSLAIQYNTLQIIPRPFRKMRLRREIKALFAREQEIRAKLDEFAALASSDGEAQG